jgi:hypothetical protein
VGAAKEKAGERDVTSCGVRVSEQAGQSLKLSKDQKWLDTLRVEPLKIMLGAFLRYLRDAPDGVGVS